MDGRGGLRGSPNQVSPEPSHSRLGGPMQPDVECQPGGLPGAMESPKAPRALGGLGSGKLDISQREGGRRGRLKP